MSAIKDIDQDEERESKRSQADELVELSAGLELYHDGDDAFADLVVEDRRETWAVRGRGVRDFLRLTYWKKRCKTPRAQSLADAVSVIEAKALHDGEARRVHLRVAEEGGAMYLDLCDRNWRAVEITAKGWRVVTEPPVRFRRSPGMLALPVPERGGTIDLLQPFLNVGSKEDLILICSWILAALSPRGPYPALVLHGEQGSAKTTIARLARGIIDPNKSDVRGEPRELRDLMVAAKSGHVIALDNMSHLEGWLSDALCGLATGRGFSARALYTDDGEVIFEARRPVILTGIDELATRGDLLDRSLLTYLPAIPEQRRRRERDYWRDVDCSKPRILGAFLDAAAEALRTEDGLDLRELPRMADFATWVAAGAPKLGWSGETFLAAYRDNRESANAVSLEASPIAPMIQALDLSIPWRESRPTY